MWLTKLKIAVIEKNIDSLNKLLDELPQLDDPQDVKQALYLLREASELLHTLKDEASSSMKKIKTNINFLNSTTANKTSKFDITL